MHRPGIVASCSFLLIIVLITGCTAQVPPQKRDVINVYVDDSGGRAGAVLIAKIRIDNGVISLTQLSTYPENEILEIAIDELGARPSLELFSEDMEDGRLVMRSVNITSGHPDYIYALRDSLVYYGIRSVVGKEIINTDVKT